MIEKTRHDIPENHPIRALFHQLTERGMGQLNLHDPETIRYITNLLTEFVQIENMYRIKDEAGQQVQHLFDMLTQASNEMSPAMRRDYYKHLGDLTLFNLGLFPESLTYGHRTVSPNYYAETGRRSYTIVAEMDSSSGTRVYRKLSEQFEQCVVGLNWVKLYINDPFYQYMFRQFDIT
jgi:3-methyladenine DNA glycosylase Tag